MHVTDLVMGCFIHREYATSLSLLKSASFIFFAYLLQLVCDLFDDNLLERILISLWRVACMLSALIHGKRVTDRMVVAIVYQKVCV
jgi:hypothetical protein